MTLAVVEKTVPMATITGRTDRRTDRQIDRRTDRKVRRNMRPPAREEGRIIIYTNANNVTVNWLALLPKMTLN